MLARLKASPSSRSNTRSPRRSHAPARRARRARHQDRAPGGRRFRARLRRAVRGLASHFVWLNRSKESLTLDVKHAQAPQSSSALLGQADVFMQNLAPGAAARLGLSFEALLAKHPRLIVCDISGYGDDRSSRAVPRQEGLRPADPERGGLRVGHRHPKSRRRPAARSPTSAPACTATRTSSPR